MFRVMYMYTMYGVVNQCTVVTSVLWSMFMFYTLVRVHHIIDARFPSHISKW